MGMWCMLIQVFPVVIPPYGPGTFLFSMIAMLWSVVWKKEREVDTLRRCFTIRERQFDYHWAAMHKMYREVMYKMESANLDAMREQKDHASSCFCKVCGYKKEKCETDWRCDAYKEFREAIEKE